MTTLPISYKNSARIGSSCFSLAVEDGIVTCFSNLEPFECFPVEDRRAVTLRIAKFRVDSGLRECDLAEAFNVSTSTVQRAANKYRKRGEEGFYKAPRGRGPSKFTEEMKQKANKMLAEGKSGADVGRVLGVPPTTVNLNRRAGVIGGGENKTEQSVVRQRGERDSRDREAAMGRGAKDTQGRVLASHGLVDEASPEFREKAGAVANAGVLSALPSLLKEGLLDSARDLFSLPRGYYGMNTVIMFLAFMLLARVRNPESIRYHSPGEWGAVLGLDRCPEVKTLRRKIRAMAGEEDRVKRWQSVLARRWMEDDPQSFAALCVDGHVKTYSGRKGNLPRKFVPREKLCLPASVSYWINALGGKPFMCIHEDMDPGMVKAVEQDVVRELESLEVLEGAADITTGEAQPVLTLVFDREGWSPALFRRLAERGIACITWHKNFKGENWSEEKFEKVNVPIWGPVGSEDAEVELGEESVELLKGFSVRQIRRRLPGGRQVPLITTHPSMSMEEVGGAMFSRWSQENYFKYMREQFNLDSLTAHMLEDLPPDTMVVNPRRREKQKLLKKWRGRLGNLRVRLARKEKSKGKKKDDVVTISKEIEELEEEIGKLGEEVRNLAEKIPVGEMNEEERLQSLGNSERLFLDIIRMIAYRAETRMMGAVIECQGKKPNARKLLQSLFTCEADILPEPEEKILRVRFLGFGSNSCERSLKNLVDELNATNTIFPGTDLRMVYELPAEIRAASPQ